MRGKVWFAGMALSLCTLVLAKDVLLAKGIEIYLSRKMDSLGISVKSIERDRNVLKVYSFAMHNGSSELFSEELSVSFHLSLVPFRLQPSVFASDLLISLHPDVEPGCLGSWPLLLMEDSWIDLKLSIEKGLFNSSLGELFSFSFLPGEKEKEMGTLLVQDKEENTFLTACLGREKGSLVADLQIVKGNVSHLIDLSSFVQKNSLEGDGEVSLSMKGRFHPLEGLEQLEGTIDLQQVNLADPLLGFNLYSHFLKGTFVFSQEKGVSFWQNTDLFLTFEDSLFLVEKQGAHIGFKEGLGEIRLHPKEDPYVKVGGQLCSQGISIPFEMEGHGQLLEKGAYWLQTELDFFLPKSSPHLGLSLCQNETREGVMQIECKSISQEILDLATLSFPLLGWSDFHLEGTEIEGKFIAQLKKGVPDKLEFSECRLKEVALQIPSQKIEAVFEQLSFSGILQRKESGLFKIDSLDSELRKASLCLNREKKLNLNSFSARIKIDGGQFCPSYLEGVYEGIFASVQVLEKSAKDLFHIECRAPSRKVLKKLFNQESRVFLESDKPIFLVLDLSQKDEKTYGLATLRIDSSPGLEEDITIEATVDKQITFEVDDLFSDWDFSSLQGFFSTEKISLDSLALGAWPLKGSFKAEGVFDSKKAAVELFELDCLLDQPSFSANLLSSNLQVEYVYKTQLSKGSILVDRLKVQSKEMGEIPLEFTKNTFFFEGSHLWADSWNGRIGDVQISGSLLVDPAGVHVISQRFGGELRDLTPLMSHYFPQISLADVRGRFTVEESACSFDVLKKEADWDFSWKAAFQCKDLGYDLGQFGEVKEGEFSFNGTSEGGGALSKIHGIYATSSNASCVFSLSDLSFEKEKKPFDFSLIAKDKVREWIRLQGKIEQNKEGITCVFTPKSNLLGIPISFSPLALDSQCSFSPVGLCSSVKVEQIVSSLALWKEMGFKSPIDDLSFLSSCKGSLELQLLYDLKQSQLKSSIKSQDFSCEGRFLGALDGIVLAEKNKVKIDSLQIGPYFAKASLEILPSEWKVPMLSLESPEGKVMLKGSYSSAHSKLSIPSFLASIRGKEVEEIQMQGSFEGNYDQKSSSLIGKGSSRFTLAFPKAFQIGMESCKETPFIFDSSKGIQLEKSDWNLLSYPSKQSFGKISSKKISYALSEQRLLVQGGLLHVAKEANLSFLPLEVRQFLGPKEIDLSMEVDLSPSFRKVSALLKNRVYSFQDKELDLKQIQLLLEQDTLYASCQSSWQETPLWLQAQVELGKRLEALALIKDQPEAPGLAIKWKTSPQNQWFCEAVQGSLKGMDLKAQYKGSDLEKRNYDVSIHVDFSEAGTLFPKEWRTSLKKWGVGKGYAFTGSLALEAERPLAWVSLRGEVKGQDFECLGKTFDLMQSKVDFTREKGSIQSFKLEDEIGSFSIKTIDLQRKKNTGLWEVSSPLVHAKDFAPALFLKGRKERGVEFKNLSLYEVKGVVSQLESFEAKGALHFSSLEKKEFSFWDVPLGFMKDWGLDPGLLTPVMGEADFVLHQGKFYFTDLRNVYSEGKRSQFYLAGPLNEAYLTLDGSWHVDLSMQQNVVWKLTEDLIVSIRGTIEKPKYSFKTNKEKQ